MSSSSTTTDDEIPFQPTTEKKKKPRFQTAASIAGNVLEWYDFAVFGFFADIISEVFFPPQRGNLALIESFGIFGGAFLMRPIGGIIMGWIGDKYGRKRALELSIFLMAFPTFAMGCLPTYAQAGNWSIVLLIIVRLLQGLSVGGQLMSSLVFTLEQNEDRTHRWGLIGSYVLAAANVGTLLGNLVAAFLQNTLSRDEMLAYGWRLPFLSGVVVSFCGLYLRWACEEDGFTNNEQHIPKNPLRTALRSGRTLLSACLVPMVWSGGFYITFVWMPTFMKDFVVPPVSQPFVINSAALFVMCLLFPLSGWLSDCCGRERTMKVGGLCFIVIAPLAMMIIGNGNNPPFLLFLSQSVLGFSLSLWGAPMMAWLVESFAPDARLTSVAIGYNIAHAIAGGLTPLVATVIADVYPIAGPGFLLTGIGIVSLVGLLCVAPSGKEERSEEENHDLEFVVTAADKDML